MTDYAGNPIPPDQALSTFDAWKSSGREIGVIFYGCSGVALYTMGFVASARNGTLRLQSDTPNASFDLALANFRSGPFFTWPRWPSGPIVEMTAIRARVENGDWLILADGLRPESPSSPRLAAVRIRKNECIKSACELTTHVMFGDEPSAGPSLPAGPTNPYCAGGGLAYNISQLNSSASAKRDERGL